MRVRASNARGDASKSLPRWHPRKQRRLVAEIELAQRDVGDLRDRQRFALRDGVGNRPSDGVHVCLGAVKGAGEHDVYRAPAAVFEKAIERWTHEVE
jgi:hypothetical protein